MTHHYSTYNKQQVIVNRKAVDYNLKHNTKYPTFIVIDTNGTWHEYHQVELRGAMMDFDPNRKLPSSFFVESAAMLTGYLDETAPPSFLNRPKQTWANWLAKWNYVRPKYINGKNFAAEFFVKRFRINF